jgi:phage shock protein PspC (stress-responsive transcriptional regulator)
MTRKLTLFAFCAFEIALILFVAAWTAWASDANSFFQRYNSPEYGKHTMQCPDEDGGAATFSVSNNRIQMYGVDLGYAEKNGNTNQYYMERPFGGVLAGISMFLDFDQRVYIQLVNGQEIFSVKCK